MPILRLIAALLLPLLLLACAAAPSAHGLEGRLIVGYQGWFGCPGDFEDNREWHHWFHGAPSADTLTVDQLPALDVFRAEDLCDTGLKRADGRAVRVFSSQNPRVVAQHLAWMRQHGIDGLALQRFVSQTRDQRLRRRSDNVLAHVRLAAERTGRVFFISYDVSGADPATAVQAIREDWKYLREQMQVTRSPAYLHASGKPYLQLWGFGLRDRPGTPREVAQLLRDLKAGSTGGPGATLIGGVPAGWRTLSGDSQSDPAWGQVYRSFDVLSPWTVGRFSDDAGGETFRRRFVEPDLAETRAAGIGYLPVAFPGFSWRNLMQVRGERAKAILNQIPRHCGRFFSRQLDGLLARGSASIYAAMFDEVDESTALLPLEPDPRAGPIGATLLAPQADGCTVATDAYLDIMGHAAGRLRAAVRGSAR